MKKLSVIAAALLLFAGVSFGQEQQKKAAAPAKQEAPKKAVKGTKTESKGSTKASGATKTAPAKKAEKKAAK